MPPTYPSEVETHAAPLEPTLKDESAYEGNASSKKEVTQKDLPTYQELLNCVPKECFEKSLLTSLAYLVWDLCVLAGMYYVEPYFEVFGIPGLIFWYFLMGMFGFSLFVVGHDCGHGTFSNYPWVNDICGHIAHAPILAPYWPWQKSHRQHHTYTGHLTKDRGHPWITEKVFEKWGWSEKQYANNPVFAFFRWVVYTFGGVTDGSHFWPGSSLFTSTTERIQCVISGLACALCAYIAFVFCSYDWFTYGKFYVVPVLCQGFWLTMVTYLQHQTDDINVYEDGTWGYVRGQMQTIDRPYGFGIDQLMHHITDGHVAHHLFFTKIPHYNLMKATTALRDKLEPFGVYRRRVSYDFLLEFCRLNMRLEYLIGEGSGLLNYAKKAKKSD